MTEQENLRQRKDQLTKRMNTLFPQVARDHHEDLGFVWTEDDSVCRVCSEPVVDGRWNYCSERCRRIANAVQRMFIWDEIREKILTRDGHTCQRCGVSKDHYWLAKRHIRDRIHELTAPLENRETIARVHQAREAFRDRYNLREIGDVEFQVDHIQPISKGGHPFDEANLQTLCRECHVEKTAQENRDRQPEDSEPDERPEIPLEEYVIR